MDNLSSENGQLTSNPVQRQTVKLIICSYEDYGDTDAAPDNRLYRPLNDVSTGNDTRCGQ
jgi:hypothetical protein